ncbi:MAG: TIM barrel protein [Caldilineaceae bacterium]|nr:TIM barrel protein [Caldilineaceae bacterium]
MTTSNLPLAVQLYSLRMLPDPFDKVLAEVAAAGYRGVETIGNHGLSASEMQELLDKHQLQAISTHVGLPVLEKEMESVIAFNQAIGNQVITIPYLAEELRPSDEAGWAALGERFGKLGKQLADVGMRLLYHNHAFEMVETNGKLMIEWMLDSTDPAYLQWEPDLAWVVRGEADPVALLQKYAGRCPRVHVKDLAPAGTNEEEKGFADVGYGTLDWATLLPAARAAGAEWYIVEHDLPQDPLRTIRRSFDYLKGKMTW